MSEQKIPKISASVIVVFPISLLLLLTSLSFFQDTFALSALARSCREREGEKKREETERGGKREREGEVRGKKERREREGESESE